MTADRRSRMGGSPMAMVEGIFNALTKVNKISTLVSEKHFNPRENLKCPTGGAGRKPKHRPSCFIRRIICRTADPARISRGRRFVANIRARLNLPSGSRTDRFNVQSSSHM
jgi:hypothetical protein